LQEPGARMSRGGPASTITLRYQPQSRSSISSEALFLYPPIMTVKEAPIFGRTKWRLARMERRFIYFGNTAASPLQIVDLDFGKTAVGAFCVSALAANKRRSQLRRNPALRRALRHGGPCFFGLQIRSHVQPARSGNSWRPRLQFRPSAPITAGSRPCPGRPELQA